jgi:hypothetical protein
MDWKRLVKRPAASCELTKSSQPAAINPAENPIFCGAMFNIIGPMHSITGIFDERNLNPATTCLAQRL